MANYNKSIFDPFTDYSVGSSVLPGYRDKLINHTGCFIGICTSGEGVISINFRDCVLRKGDILMTFWDTAPLLVRTTDDFSINWCMLKPELTYDVCYPIYIDFFNYMLTNPVHHVTDKEKPALEKWWELLLYICRDLENSHQLLLVRNHVQNLLLKADNSVKNILSKGEIPTSRFQGLFATFCKLLWKYHYKEHHDVKFYADKLNISTCYLSRVTRGTVGQSPKKLIDNFIVHEMKVLLNTQDITVNELARMFHFEDPSYMCRYFKRQTSLSLTGYKKQNL